MKQKLLYTLAFLFVSLLTFADGKTTYEYDGNNRLTKVTYGNGMTVTYNYDALGNRTSKKISGGLILGDANGDGSVTITDAVGIVNYILGNPSANFNEAAADVNSDGNITITDAVGVVNIILNNGSSGAPAMNAPIVDKK